MNSYKPGQSVRIALSSYLLNVLTDPSNSVVTVSYPGGTTETPTPEQDSQGMWHADFTIPMNIPPGIAAYRWQSTGASTSQDALAERRFTVLPLDF